MPKSGGRIIFAPDAPRQILGAFPLSTICDASPPPSRGPMSTPLSPRGRGDRSAPTRTSNNPPVSKEAWGAFSPRSGGEHMGADAAAPRPGASGSVASAQAMLRAAAQAQIAATQDQQQLPGHHERPRSLSQRKKVSADKAKSQLQEQLTEAMLHKAHGRSVQTLFSGSRMCSGHPRSKCTVFKKPSGSGRIPAHTRPIFMCGENGVDARTSLDCRDPYQNSSAYRTRYEKTWAQTAKPQQNRFGGQSPVGWSSMPNSRCSSRAASERPPSQMRVTPTLASCQAGAGY